MSIEAAVASWRDRAATGRMLPSVTQVEELAATFQDDVWKRALHEFVSAKTILHACENIEFYLQIGDIDKAQAALTTMENGVEFVVERLRLREVLRLAAAERKAVVEERQRREQRSEAGKAPKRKPWAEEVGRRFSSWEDIPGPHQAVQIETVDRDLEIYRDGDTLVCFEKATQREEKLKKSSYQKRYAGQQRR